MSNNRVPTDYAVTRKLKRTKAKEAMKAEGKKNFCKHGYTTLSYRTHTLISRDPSYFAEHWREYV